MMRREQRQRPLRVAVILASAVAFAGSAPADAQQRAPWIMGRASIPASPELDRGPREPRGVDRRRESPAEGVGLPEQDRDERVDRRTHVLALGPNGSLELRNIAGDITVTVGSRPDVVLEVVRRSRARTGADTALAPQDALVEIDHRGERASVEAVRQRRSDAFQFATSYTATVPVGTRITARSFSGNLSVENVVGDVAVETVSGTVTVIGGSRVSKARSISGDVTLTDIDGDGALVAGSINGTLTLTRVRARQITAEVISGDVLANDVTCDSAQLKSVSGSVEYVGPLARNGRYELNSHSGSVRLVAEGPVGFDLQASSFGGRIRPEGLPAQPTRAARGSLRATVGDGSAVVVVRTFSGDVVVEKR